MNERIPLSPPAPSAADPGAPVEAIVLDEPPVRRPPGAGPASPMRAIPRAVAPKSNSPPGKTYVVPKRFGVSGILAMITAMGFLFGFLRFLQVPPVVFLFLGTMVLVISIVQMFCGQVPRLASVVAGAVLSPLFAAAALAFSEQPHLGQLICVIWGSVFWGALGGYLTGTCAAGVFLVMEKIDPYLPGGRSRAAGQSNCVAQPQQGNTP
jgi:hypothetical protein